MDKRQNKEKKAKFNIIDALIIVAIVACIVAIGLRVYFSSRENKTPDHVICNFEVSGISEENANSFAEGKKVYLDSDDAEVGAFRTVEIIAETVNATDKDGNVVKATVPGKCTVKGTVTLYGKYGDDGLFYVNGETPVSLGSVVSVYTDRNRFSMTIIGFCLE